MLNKTELFTKIIFQTINYNLSRKLSAFLFVKQLGIYDPN